VSSEEDIRPENRRPKRLDGVAHDLEEDGVIALFDRTGLRLLVLDTIGSGVWMLADGTRTRDQIVDEILLVFDAPRSEVVADVDRFLEALARHALLEFA